ncbi:MAG: RIP metalloprotease RseP [Clostridiales bacterium]|nr:RIP metalloprotease RseP [Clostridiales bacterium]
MLNLLCDVTSVLKTVGYVLLAFVVLLFMVLIHETGHYTAGKILDFQINEFAIGMGPKIFSKKKKNGEIFSLRIFPLGGFCAFEGEDDDKDNPRAFNNQKPWKRLIVLFSGAFFNFVSAILIAIIAFSCFGDTVAKVNTVYDYAPIENQQLQSGDILYKINGKRVFVLDTISRYMSDGDMKFTVLRSNDEGKYDFVELDDIQKGNFASAVLSKIDCIVAPVNGRELQTGDTIYKLNGHSLGQEGDFDKYLNIALANGQETCTLTVSDGSNTYEYVVATSDIGGGKLVVGESAYSGVGMAIYYDRNRFGFGESFFRAFPYCGEVGMLVLRTLGGLITGAVGVDQVGGPITTISMTTQVISTGLANVLMLIVLISVNLAVFNLLPVPALDGCRMVFVLIEWIARKPINRKVEAYINGIGLIVLIVLMVLIDLLKL